MQAPSDEIETLTATPTAPALDPERIAIEVELVSPSNPPSNTKKHKYAPVEESTAEESTEEESLPREKPWCQCDAWKRKLEAAWDDLQYHRELLIVYGAMLITMCVVAVSTTAWFSSRRETASRWKRIMETTGFVDWSQLKESSAPEIFATIIIGASIVSLVLVPASLLNRSRRGLRLASSLAMLASVTSFVSYLLSRQQISISGETVESMMKQAVPVANFNRGFCYAWCRKSDAGLVALARGECGPHDRTVFDEISARFDVKDWCTQAIAHQNYDLLANYSGIPPFAGLKGEAGRNLTDMSAKKDHGLTALLSVMQLWMGPLPLFLDLIPYGWR